MPASMTVMVYKPYSQEAVPAATVQRGVVSRILDGNAKEKGADIPFSSKVQP